MARTVGRRRLSPSDKRAIFDKAALETMRERERTAPKQGQAVHKGVFVVQRGTGQWETPFLTGKPSFKTLKAAKLFIDRRAREK